MIFNVSGGGGTALNFRVVGNPKPSTAKENTIWIDTDVPITSYIFSATQPTGVPGMVWISTGTSSTVAFNALKKNGIQVYPISAKQYVSGAWVDKTAKIYQGGEWKVFIEPFWYFKSGVGITNEFVVSGGHENDTSSSEYLLMHVDAGLGRDAYGVFRPAKKMSEFRELNIEIRYSAKHANSAGRLRIGLGDSPQADSKITHLLKEISFSGTEVYTETLKLPVSTYEETLYVKIWASVTSTYYFTDIYIWNVWLS